MDREEAGRGTGGGAAVGPDEKEKGGRVIAIRYLSEVSTKDGGKGPLGLARPPD
jgi:hypothetical protein